MDGNSYELSRFVLSGNGRAVLDFIIAPVVNDVAELEGFSIRRARQGVLVFEIECMTGCELGSDYIEVYADTS